MLESFGQLGWYCLQLIRMGDGQEPNLDMTLLEALGGYEANETKTLEAWSRPA